MQKIRRVRKVGRGGAKRELDGIELEDDVDV